MKILNNTYNETYFDYSFECREDFIKKDEKIYDNQIKAFNGGGSGG